MRFFTWQPECQLNIEQSIKVLHRLLSSCFRGIQSTATTQATPFKLNTSNTYMLLSSGYYFYKSTITTKTIIRGAHGCR